MQGINSSQSKGVLVLAATNLPWGLDSAMRRRFEKRVYIALPDIKARFELLKNSMKNEDHTLTDNDFTKIAKNTEFYSGSDLSTLVKNACFGPLRKFQGATHFVEVGKGKKGESLWMATTESTKKSVKIDKHTIPACQIRKNPIDNNDFLNALKNTKPTVGPKELKEYEKWTKLFGNDGSQ